MSKWYNRYNLDDIREKIACPQLGDDHYGEWGALPLEVRKTINFLIGAVVVRDGIIEANRKKVDEIRQQLKVLGNGEDE